MAVKEILQLGNQVLRTRCAPVKNFHHGGLQEVISDLAATLLDFKSRRGFGRGIAAPQVGVSERVIFVNIDHPLALVNPVIKKRSRQMMTLWDDCFSFPDLLTKVRRNLAIEVRYQDQEGHSHTLRAEGALSELLQHEIDHVDGILALDRAIDSRHIVYRSEYEKWLKHAEGVVL
jgi:peptide deformylase